MSTTQHDTSALRIPQAAKNIDCSPDTIRRMIARGELRAVRYGRSIRIWPEDLAKAGRPVTRIAANGGERVA